MAGPRRRIVIHVSALTIVAIAAPVFAYLNAHREVLTSDDGGHVFGVTLGVLLIPAVVLFVLRAAISRLSASAAYLFYFGSITVLGAVAVAPPAVRAGLRFVPAVVMGVGIFVFLVVLYRHSPELRRWIATIFPVVFIFPLVFTTDAATPGSVDMASVGGGLLVGSFAAGLVAVRIGLLVAPRILRGPRHVRSNFRGDLLLATAGSVLVLPVLTGYAFAIGDRAALVMAAAAIATAVLGYIDDVYGDRQAGGLFGHARALLHGDLTTGMMKAAGGVVIGLTSAWFLGHRGAWIVIAGAVIALASNLANLFDLRPGRVVKLWVPGAVLLLLLSQLGDAAFVVVAVAGGLVAFLIDELAERVMLGDTGAGVLGAVLGVGAAAAGSHLALVVVAAVLLALTLVSEKVSFTKVIEATPPLRWLDSLGRKPA